jgi:hypothetical protein
VKERLLSWAARFSAAAALLGALELLFVAFAFVTGIGSGLAALQTWTQLAFVLWLFGLLSSVPLALLDREPLRRFVPSAALLTSSLLSALVCLLLLGGVDRALSLAHEEFPDDLARVRSAARLVALLVTFGAALLLHERVRARFKRSAPSVQRAVVCSVLLAGAVFALWCADFAFSPVHEVAAAGVGCLAALLLMALSLRACAWPARPTHSRLVVLVTGVVGILGTFVPGPARDHAKFVLWNHSSAAGLSELLRGLLDRDRDAVLPAWLAGGGDCKPGEHAVSPLQLEVPGDGVDQDCRGGDARAVGPTPKAAPLANCALPAERLDVLTIAVDALRADAFDADIMPSLHELARHSIVFERAYSPTAMTLTSVSAILSGRPFADVGPKNALLDEQLAPDVTAPELFQKAGYRTAAFSAFFDHALFRRGFQAVNAYWHDEQPGGVKGTLTSAAVSRGILEVLGASAEPAFVWAHLSDTHARYSRDRDAKGNVLSEAQAYYRGAVYVDQQLGTLFGELDKRGRLNRTIIAVTADHGEELLARGRQGHGPNLFEESVHVPLVLWVPGCAARRVSEPVSLAHLMPSLGALTRVDVPGAGLLPAGARDLPTVVEAVTALNTSYKRAIIRGNFKLLVDVTNGGRLLFDLASDPLELSNILSDEPERAAELERDYQRWLDAPGRR